MRNSSISLALPAQMEYALVARMALSGFALLLDMDVGLIDDLRTVADECCDCLLHQPWCARELHMNAELRDRHLCCVFEGVWDNEPSGEANTDIALARGILETLVTELSILEDDKGVYRVSFSVPLSDG